MSTEQNHVFATLPGVLQPLASDSENRTELNRRPFGLSFDVMDASVPNFNWSPFGTSIQSASELYYQAHFGSVVPWHDYVAANVLRVPFTVHRQKVPHIWSYDGESVNIETAPMVTFGSTCPFGNATFGQAFSVFVEYTLSAPNSTFQAIGSPKNENRTELDTLRANAGEEWDPPTDHAYEMARAMVESWPDLLSAFITTDSGGGIRMIWRRGAKLVRANFAARPGLRSYIYFESPTLHDVEELKSSNLKRRMDWLNE